MILEDTALCVSVQVSPRELFLFPRHFLSNFKYRDGKKGISP